MCVYIYIYRVYPSDFYSCYTVFLKHTTTAVADIVYIYILLLLRVNPIGLKVLCSYEVTAICKLASLMYMSEFCCYVMLNF